MTYQKIKDTLVNDKKQLTNKELHKLVLNVSLFILGLCLCLSLLTVSILGFPVTILVIIGCIIMYMSMFEFCVEDEKNLRKIVKITRFWIIFPIIFVAMYLVLQFFNFS